MHTALKSDAGWSSMFSATSGESLKDIKDRLNIRKRGPGPGRGTVKEKKAAQTVGTALVAATTASVAAAAVVDSAAKERLVNAAVEISRLAPIAQVRASNVVCVRELLHVLTNCCHRATS